MGANGEGSSNGGAPRQLGRKIPGYGPAPCDLMLIAEAGGVAEEKSGRPLVGKTGRETARYMSQARLVRLRGDYDYLGEHVYLTNVVKYRPFTRTLTGNNPPSPEEIRRDEPELIEEIRRVQPKFIGAVGAVAARWLIGAQYGGMDENYGLPYRLSSKRAKQIGYGAPITANVSMEGEQPWIIPLIHPAAGMHSPGTQPHIYDGFMRLGQYVRGELPLTVPVDPFTDPDYYEVKGASVSLIRNRSVYIDTEGLLGSVWGLSFTQHAGSAGVIRVENKRAVRSIRDQLRGMTVVMHHAIHDVPILSEMFGMTIVQFLAHIKGFEDTMVKAYVLRMPPLALKPSCRRYLGMSMETYLDIVYDADREIAVDYLKRLLRTNICTKCSGAGEYVDRERVSAKTGKELTPMVVTCGECEGDGTSLPDPEVTIEYVDGLPMLRRGHRIGKRVRGILKDMRVKPAETDPRDRWEGVDYQYRIKVEDVAGAMRPVSLNDVEPQERARDYSCLAGMSLINTEGGLHKISSLVRDHYDGLVWSVNTSTGVKELRKVVGWYRNVHDDRVDWMSVDTTISRGGRWGTLNTTRYTPDHRLLTDTGQWVAVSELVRGQSIQTDIQKLNSVELQVMLGSVLGDGSLSRRNDDGWVQFRTSNAADQREYLHWKAGLFTTYEAHTAVIQQRSNLFCGRPVKRQDQYSLELPSLAELVPYRDSIYSGVPNERVVSDWWLNDIDWLAIAIWYQDDGTLVGGKTARLYTLSFNPTSVGKLHSMLANKGIEATVYDVSGSVSRLFTQAMHIRARSSGRFFTNIAPYVHPVMRYKLPVAYRSVPFIQVPTACSRGLLTAAITRVYRNPASAGRRGSLRTSYCLDVEGNHNFVTAGNEVAHNCRDADATLRYDGVLEEMIGADAHSDRLRRVYNIDRDSLPLLMRMTEVGIKVDVPALRRLSVRLTKENANITHQLKRLAGRHINPASSKQVAEFLFDDLRLPPVALTKGGDESTADKVLEDLKLQVAEWPESSKKQKALDGMGLITDYRERVKLKGSYADKIPRMVDRNDRVHTTFRATTVESGRVSSADPGLQQIPDPSKGELGGLVRNAFIAPEGFALVESDYSQMELRYSAHDSGDENMIRVYRNNEDIHAQTAARMFGIPIAQVTKKQRRAAKTVNFSVLYGITPPGLKARVRVETGLDVSVETAAEWIDHWLNHLFPEMNGYFLDCYASARRYGYAEDMYGMRRYLPGMHSAISSVRAESERISVNHRVQGSCASIMKLSCPVLLDEVIPRVRKAGWDCDPLLTVHDAFVCQVEKGGEEMLMDLMEKAMTEQVELKVPLTVDSHAALSWGAMKG